MSKLASLNSTVSTKIKTKRETHHLNNYSVVNDRSVAYVYKKKIKEYLISYCPKEMLGRSLYGEVRMGHNQEHSKVVVFRVNTLPVSEHAKHIIGIQEQMSKISDCVCQIYDIVDTKTNKYIIMEYFPKTFKTELSAFQKSNKYFSQFLQKFFHAYAKLYYLRVSHGNINLDNIGITYDGKVKLMDFRPISTNFEEAARKDYRDFRAMLCTIMLRDKVFPTKLQCLDHEDGNWQKLFSSWHTVNPYQYIYVKKRNKYQNIVVLLHKIENSVIESDCQNQEHLQIAIRGLILQNLQKLLRDDKEKAEKQIYHLKKMLSPIFQGKNQRDKSSYYSYYNSMIWGFIEDPQYFGLTHTHQLALICCFFDDMNHQYLFAEILHQLDTTKMYQQPSSPPKPHQEQIRKNNVIHEILATNLLRYNKQMIKEKLLKQSRMFIDRSQLLKSMKTPQKTRNNQFSRTIIERSNNQKHLYRRQPQKNTKIQYLKNKISNKFAPYKSVSSINTIHFMKNVTTDQSANTKESSSHN